MIEVKRRARSRLGGAGDPLDGLVNMFDLGIVLAVAFLIAALQSHDLTSLLTQRSARPAPGPSIVVRGDQKLEQLKPGETRVPVRAAKGVGTVYQLRGGQLVYVTRK